VGDEIIRCIYCKQDRPASREHVLARSLGGDFTKPMICVPCNGGRLSPIDQALAERSLVALSRVAYTPASAFTAKLGFDGFLVDAGSGLTLEVAMVNEMQTVVLPQVHVRRDAEKWHIAPVAADADASGRLRTFIEARISAGTLRDIHVKVGPSGAGSTPRLVMHRKDDAFVRVQTKEDAELLFKGLEETWVQNSAAYAEAVAAGEGRSRIDKPFVELHMEIRIDDTYRAVVKTAFNVLAARVGTEFALSPEFDPIRAYILGDDIRHSTSLKEGEIAVDGRFVQMLEADTEALVPTEEHAVTIFYSPPALLAWVTLYKTHNFVVRLGEVPLPEPVLTTHEFSTVRRGNAALDIAELFTRLSKREALRRPKT
jgi:hypothetical protein